MGTRAMQVKTVNGVKSHTRPSATKGGTKDPGVATDWVTCGLRKFKLYLLNMEANVQSDLPRSFFSSGCTRLYEVLYPHLFEGRGTKTGRATPQR